MKRKKGFTLIELLAVVTLIGILSSIAVISIPKIIKIIKRDKLFADINTIVKNVTNINIEGTENCWYRSKKDNYKLPKDIKDIEIFIFRENNEYKYGVIAYDENEEEIIHTDDFKNLNKNSNWVDENKPLNKYLGINTDPDDVKEIFNTKFCEVMEEINEK